MGRVRMLACRLGIFEQLLFPSEPHAPIVLPEQPGCPGALRVLADGVTGDEAAPALRMAYPLCLHCTEPCSMQGGDTVVVAANTLGGALLGADNHLLLVAGATEPRAG